MLHHESYVEAKFTWFLQSMLLFTTLTNNTYRSYTILMHALNKNNTLSIPMKNMQFFFIFHFLPSSSTIF
jgi:hypothetical protein